MINIKKLSSKPKDESLLNGKPTMKYMFHYL